MRVADKIAFGQVDRNLQKNRSEMLDLQNQAATQKRINKPSDDPTAAARVLVSRTEDRGTTQFIKNLNNAKAFLDFTDQSLAEMSDVLVRAKELALSQASDAGASTQTRQVTATEVEQLYGQTLQVANRKLADRYIFAGFRTQTPPFNSAGEYQGDEGDIKIHVHKDSFVAMNVPGNRIFLGQGLGQDGIARATIDTPTDVKQLHEWREGREVQRQEAEQIEEAAVHTRGPASSLHPNKMSDRDPVDRTYGINVFRVLKDLETALRTDDKENIQESLNELDQAFQQLVLARADVGSRSMQVNSTLDSLTKASVDHKVSASQLEDADVFKVVSDINKTDSALRASLETSGRVTQKSLIDFLR